MQVIYASHASFLLKALLESWRLKYKPRTLAYAWALDLHLRCAYSKEFLLCWTEEYFSMKFYVHYHGFGLPPSLGLRSTITEERASGDSPAQKGRIAGTGTSCSLGTNMNGDSALGSRRVKISWSRQRVTEAAAVEREGEWDIWRQVPTLRLKKTCKIISPKSKSLYLQHPSKISLVLQKVTHLCLSLLRPEFQGRGSSYWKVLMVVQGGQTVVGVLTTAHTRLIIWNSLKLSLL